MSGTNIYIDRAFSSVFTVRYANGSLVSGYELSLTTTVYDQDFSNDDGDNPALVTEVGGTGIYKYGITPNAIGSWTVMVVDNAGDYETIAQLFNCTEDNISMLETNEDASRSISSVQTSHTSQLNTLEEYVWNPLNSMNETTQSMLETNYDAIAGTASDSSKLETLEDYHWDTVSILDTLQSGTDGMSAVQTTHTSMLETNEDASRSISSVQTSHTSQLNTLEEYVWNPLSSQLNTLEEYVWNPLSSQLDTQETYSHEIVSRCKTIDSHVLWNMTGKGTGAYYYDQDGYYRNSGGAGDQILWATGETGTVTDSETGTPIDNAVVTAYIVVGSFATGERTTGNKGIADQTTTNPSGEYDGFLDAGIYDFQFTKDDFVSEYHRRQLTTS